MTKHLVLGTAQWGWTVSPTQAFGLLDQWLATGHKRIDCATNYPINRQPADFRAAEHILGEYIRAHGLGDLQVTMKIGSLDNMRSPDVNLAPSFIQMMAGEYRRQLGNNLDCLMFHWDNRQEEQAIFESLEALSRIKRKEGIRPGLSGIKHPEIYAKANVSLGLKFDIQLKHNLLQSDLNRYLPVFASTEHNFFAYGINAGGIKLEGQPYPAGSTYLARGGQPENIAPLMKRLSGMLPGFNKHTERPEIRSMNQLGMIYSALNPHIHGILLGVSTEAQLTESIGFWEALGRYEFQEVYDGLSTLQTP